MGKRERRLRESKNARARLEELLAKGDTRGAVEAAKVLVREEPGAASESLAVKAYADRIKALIAEGLGREAAAIAAIVRERFPAHVGSHTALLEDARLAGGDLDWIFCELRTASDEGRSAMDAADPLAREAKAVAELFEIVTSRIASTEEMAQLNDIRRRSPLAPWKLLVRAIDAFHRNEDDRVAANVAAIHVRSPAARGGEVLSELTTGRKKVGASSAAELLVDRISGGRATIAIRNRQEAAVGIVPARESLPRVDVASAVAGAFGSRESTFRELVRLTFHFGERVVLEPLTSGFSGARVFRAFVREKETTGEANQWLLKVSDSPSKLNKELQAHTAMMRAGLEFATAVPLLWRGVVVEGKLGAIAYKFAPNTTPATEFTSDDGALMLNIGALLGRYYGGAGRATEYAVLQEILRKYGPRKSVISRARVLINGATAELCDSVWNDTTTALAEAVSLTQTRIHGDLHLGNIMLGSSPVLIDFALSGVAPVAVDAAKLVSDLIVRRASLRGETIPQWGDGGALMSVFEPLCSVFALSQSDRMLFDRLLQLQLAAMLTYEDLPVDSRDWITARLST